MATYGTRRPAAGRWTPAQRAHRARSAVEAWPAMPTLRQEADGTWVIQGDPTEAALARRRAQARACMPRSRPAIRAHRRGPVHLRAQDDVHPGHRPRARRRARDLQQGRAGCPARPLHGGARVRHGRAALDGCLARPRAGRRERAVGRGPAHAGRWPTRPRGGRRRVHADGPALERRPDLRRNGRA
ncbi:MAG: hypothetical protein MZU91_12375 [Desulfosudis oleivorans]|nr:hypothetical protein [Desulfosudis oleivorans]